MALGDRAVIVECSTHPRFLSNTYLVCDGEGGPAFFVDAGGPVQPLIEAAERLRADPTHVLLTHHHFDHVCEVEQLRARWPQLEVMTSAIERDLLQGAGNGQDGVPAERAPAPIEAGQTLDVGRLEVRPLHTPGHTAGMLSFLVGEESGAGAGSERARGRGGATAPGGFEGGAARCSRTRWAASKPPGTPPTPICATRSWER